MGQHAGTQAGSALAVTDDPAALIRQALTVAEGNVAKAAWLLGLDRTKLYPKIHDLGMAAELEAIRLEAKRRQATAVPHPH